MKVRTMFVISAILLLVAGCAGLTEFGRLTKKGDIASENREWEVAVNYYLSALRIRSNYEPAKSGVELAAKGYFETQKTLIENAIQAKAWEKAERLVQNAFNLLNQVKLYSTVYPTQEVMGYLQEKRQLGNQAIAEEQFVVAKEAWAEEDYHKALLAIQRCRSYNAAYPGAEAMEKKIRGKLAALSYDRGMKADEAGNLQEALRAYEEASGYVEDYEDVAKKIRNVKTKLAEECYVEGQELLKEASETKSPRTYRKAAQRFSDALGYVRNYKDASLLYEKARQNSIVRVVVMPFRASSADLPQVGDLLTQDIIAKALERKPELMQFIDREGVAAFLITQQNLQDLGVLDQNATQQLKGASVHIVVTGSVFVTQRSAPEQKNTKTGTYTVKYVDGEGNVRYKEEKFNYFLVSKGRSVELRVTYHLLDVETGSIITSKTHQTKYSDEARWVEAKTDLVKFAAQEEGDSLTSYSEPKSIQELANQAVDELSRTISFEIIDEVAKIF